MRTTTASLVYLDATEMGKLNSGVAIPLTINGTSLLLQKDAVNSTKALQSQKMKAYWANKKAEKRLSK